MKTIVIAGINGFAGYHTARAARNHDLRVVGIGREDTPAAHVAEFVDSYFSCDLSNKAEVNKLDISDATAIINLAGFAKVGVNESEREEYLRVNTDVHTMLAAHLLENDLLNIRMVSVSSGTVYTPDQPLPLTENSRLQNSGAASVYCASKLLMEESLRTFINQGVDVVIARSFNHSGPGQQPGFLIPDLAQKILAAENSAPVKTGNLATKRDYSHAEDVAEAYILLATTPNLTSTVYNICSGSSVQGEQIFDLLKNKLGHPEATHTTDSSLTRSMDPSEIYGSYDLLHADTGWSPTKDITRIVEDFCDWFVAKK